MKNFWKGFAALYLVMAVINGIGASRIPATNGFGIAYYGALWPAWAASVALNSPLVPIPSWCFTFE